MGKLDKWKREKKDAVENLKRSGEQRVRELQDDVRLWVGSAKQDIVAMQRRAKGDDSYG